MLRAPTCSMSAYSATIGSVSVSFTSVTTLSPVASRARASSFSPSSRRPWNSYGLVRGLNAPPRRKRAPDRFTACAASRIWSFDSTEQGPAMMLMARPPRGTPETSRTVSSSFTSRDTSLKGCDTRSASATPDMLPNRSSGSSPVMWPITATTFRSVPTMGWGVSPRARIFSTTASNSAGVAWGFMAMNIAGSCPAGESESLHHTRHAISPNLVFHLGVDPGVDDPSRSGSRYGLVSHAPSVPRAPGAGSPRPAGPAMG